MRQHSYFGVTHCENSEVQIAVFSKLNMLQGWKLVQRFIFYFSSTYLGYQRFFSRASGIFGVG